jgi:hypothetical protein
LKSPSRVFWLTAAVPVVFAGTWLLWGLLSTSSAVQAYERIQLGMTVGEVERIMGTHPAGSDPGLPQVCVERKGPPDGWVVGNGTLVCRRWYRNDYLVEVYFDGKGEVISCWLFRFPSWFDRLLAKVVL